MTTAAPPRFQRREIGSGSEGVWDAKTRKWVPDAAFTGPSARHLAEETLDRIRDEYRHGRTPPARTGRNPQ